MSTVAVVPNERTELPYETDELRVNVETRVRNIWRRFQNFPALTGVDTLKSDEEQYQEFKASRLGRFFVQWSTVVERYNLSLWHLDALLYFVFLIILLFGMLSCRLLSGF
jgi:hypothetical protein